MHVDLDISKNITVGVWKDERGNKLSGETFSTNEEGLEKPAEKLTDLLRTNMLPACYIHDNKIRGIGNLIRHRKPLVRTKN